MKLPRAGKGGPHRQAGGNGEGPGRGTWCQGGPEVPSGAHFFVCRTPPAGVQIKQPMSQATILLLVAGAAVVAAVGYLVARARSPKEEPVFNFKCPNCHRKLRFRARQSGHRGACPQCKQALVFPPVGK